MNIPDGVTRIERNTFSYCYGLTDITIPNSVTDISSEAFSYCYSLTNLTIGSSVERISEKAFENCPSLVSVTSLNTTPPSVYSAIFDTTTELNATLHVPTGCKTAYMQAEYWKNFFKIEDDATAGIGSVTADKQGKAVIYTLDGKRMNATTAADLPTGIYIINGKKHVVK